MSIVYYVHLTIYEDRIMFIKVTLTKEGKQFVKNVRKNTTNVNNALRSRLSVLLSKAANKVAV